MTNRAWLGLKPGLIVKLGVPLVIAFFIGRSIHGNWRQVQNETWHLDAGYLFWSFVLSSGWFVARPFGWRIVINCFGNAVPYGEIYRVYRKSELSRYVPGGVWQFASRIYLTRRYGVEPSACIAATLVDMVLAALAAMVPAVWVVDRALPQLAPYQRAVLLAFPLLALAVVHPKVLNLWAGYASRLLKQPYTELRISARALFGVWAAYVLSWIGLAFGMGLFVRGLLPAAAEHIGFIAASYALAWITALLTMVAPAGMGIREGILGLLLGQALAAGTALAVAVAIRLWLISMELAWWALGRWFPKGPVD